MNIVHLSFGDEDYANRFGLSLELLDQRLFLGHSARYWFAFEVSLSVPGTWIGKTWQVRLLRKEFYRESFARMLVRQLERIEKQGAGR